LIRHIAAVGRDLGRGDGFHAERFVDGGDARGGERGGTEQEPHTEAHGAIIAPAGAPPSAALTYTELYTGAQLLPRALSHSFLPLAFVLILRSADWQSIKSEGDRHYLAGDYDAALQRYTEALASAPPDSAESAGLRVKLGNAFWMKGDYAAAQA